jgi:hypothetical protein
VRNTNYSILARNQARRHWVYSSHYSGTFVAQKMHETQKPSVGQGLYQSPLLALSALMTSAYSSLRVSRESNPQPQLLKALV